MKIFYKEKIYNTRIIYFCGLKLFSYTKKIKNRNKILIKYINQQSLKTFNNDSNKSHSKLLFYTYANYNYYEFAILYPFFALFSNPDSIVEILVDDLEKFKSKYSHLISFYNQHNYFKNKVLYRQVDKNLLCLEPGTIRFASQPFSKAEYVYIGDIDILIFKNIYDTHIKNIKDNNLDFSNIKRLNKKLLTGLHFIEYKKMYPLNIDENMQLINEGDEAFLYNFMNTKGFKIPNEQTITYRPICGIHISYFSRPILSTITTNDRHSDFPSWGPFNCEYLDKYSQIRNSDLMQEFTNLIKDNDVLLRKLIQVIDITCFYIKNNPQYIKDNEK